MSDLREEAKTLTLAEVIRRTAEAVRNGPLDWRRAIDRHCERPGSEEIHIILPRPSAIGIREAIKEVREAMGHSLVVDGKRVSGIPGWLEALDTMLR